ncbi:MAG: S41 family peptidase, partial [Vicinamibacteria bacterium]
ELSDLIGWMVGELSVLHTSVRGGDLRAGPDDVKVPTLGARLVRDVKAGGYRIDYIYKHDPDYPDERSPLADPELNINVGDLIQAVNGVDTLSTDQFESLLRAQEKRQVLLKVKAGAVGASREVIVVPTIGERNLRYTDWEYTRRLAVEEKSKGALGYVHLRAMGGDDVTSWYRHFYPAFNRDGIVIDVRHNNGGNIDAFILEKLMRRAWMYWKSRAGEPYWNMMFAPRGHLVVLVDENTASDGEAFAEGFRRLGLGKIIGRRGLALRRESTLRPGHRARTHERRLRSRESVAGREPRRGSRHRGRQSAACDVHGPGRATRRGHRIPPGRDQERPETGPEAARVPGQELQIPRRASLMSSRHCEERDGQSDEAISPGLAVVGEVAFSEASRRPRRNDAASESLSGVRIGPLPSVRAITRGLRRRDKLLQHLRKMNIALHVVRS